MPGSGTGKPGKGKTPKPPKTTPATPGSGTGKPGKGKTPKPPSKGKAPRHRRYTWKKNPVRKAGSLLKSGFVKTRRGTRRTWKTITSRKFRRRLHKAWTPFRAVYRGTRKHGGKLAANVMRVGGRWILATHTFLGTIRLSTKGPNWLRPLSRVLHWATSPLAMVVNISRRWTWLSTWIYATATARPITKPVTTKTPPTPTAGTGTPAPAPSPAGHATVPSPATAPTGGPTVGDTSPVHHAYPLIYAADAIRAAGAAFAAAPADSMKGYEAVIETLGHLDFAMCHLMHTIAQVTEEDFKVDPAIPDHFRSIGIQFLMLGGFVDSAHKVFRDLHAAQLENLENPTWQGRKWDISANWAHIMPAYSWRDPASHTLPLLLASGAIRDAGVHIRLHPSGTMFGYEETIRQLAPLAEALYGLMETVASVTETEFAVHPAIPAMHRDAGQRFRDLAGSIETVHLMYLALHQEQILNLLHPTYQGAKWDIGRNTTP
ncbi:hypothetical protein [Streptomyces filamentosus]|uniref:hypothetical protein n=1 Tax=Streptomyces filamentosus TaxID=67294 RepID=UPI0033D7062D